LVPRASRDDRRLRLWLATFGLTAVVGLFVATVSAYLSAVRAVDHTLVVRETIDEWLSDVRTAESSARRYLETTDPADRTAFTLAAERERQAAARFRSLVADNTRQTQAGTDSARHGAHVADTQKKNKK